MRTSQFLSRSGAILALSMILLFPSAVFAQNQEQISRQKQNFNSIDAYSSGQGGRPRIYPDNSADSTALPAKKVVATSVLELMAFDLLNQKRMESGLKPVIWNEEIARIARIHSRDMAEHNFFSHKGFNGLMVDDRAEATGFNDWRRIGENIAYNRGYEDPVSSAIMHWMQSPGHRQNLLSDKWKESGVGIALAPDGVTYYFTQVFVLRK